MWKTGNEESEEDLELHESGGNISPLRADPAAGLLGGAGIRFLQVDTINLYFENELSNIDLLRMLPVASSLTDI